MAVGLIKLELRVADSQSGERAWGCVEVSGVSADRLLTVTPTQWEWLQVVFRVVAEDQVHTMHGCEPKDNNSGPQSGVDLS